MKYRTWLLQAFLLLTSAQITIGQKICDCDSVRKNDTFSDYCIEYLDAQWLEVKKNKAQFKRYVLYQNGRKSNQYPWEFIPKNEKLTCNDSDVVLTDSVTFLNGLYKIYDKKGFLIHEIFYKSGYIIKGVYRYAAIYSAELRGKVVLEIAEYDYSTFPFRKHVMWFKLDGTIKQNSYITYENGIWLYEGTKDLMTSNPLDFKN
jgi:hypothetical protein